MRAAACLRLVKKRRMILPLPEGEGRGEGEAGKQAVRQAVLAQFGLPVRAMNAGVKIFQEESFPSDAVTGSMLIAHGALREKCDKPERATRGTS